MALRLVQTNFKTRDHATLGRFWADALGWEWASDEPGVSGVEPAGSVYPDPAVLGIDFVDVPDPETVQYRAHLELASRSIDHQRELVAHLERLGATSVGSGDTPWVELADPEGNVFRVLEPRAIYTDTGPIAAVVVRCADPGALGRFWGAALDWSLLESSDDLARLRSAAGVGPYLEFVHASGADEPSRLHLDAAPYSGDDLAAEVSRLVSLGATPADVGQGDVAWAVLADVAGNEFCVLTPR